MRVGPVEFQPSLIPSLVTLVLVPIMLSLAFWQLGRADEKRAWLAVIEQAQHTPPFALNDALPAYEQAQYRLARAQGVFDADRVFLLNNQIEAGRLGYRALLPLRLKGTDSAVLVEGDWLPAEQGAQPVLEVPEGEIELVGQVGKGPAVAFRLGVAGDATRGWPLEVHYMDFEFFQEQLPYPLLPYVLRPGEDVQVPKISMTPEKHVGYAVQWFAMTLALVVIYLAVNTKRRRGDDSER